MLSEKNKRYISAKNIRTHILKSLFNNPKQYVSGQTLSKELNITRTSIWKYIKTLQEDGFKIECSTKLGYKLISVPDLILPHIIEENQGTVFMGKKVYYYKIISSTNEIAQKLARNNSESGTLVISETQNMGKGRYSRPWISPRGGLWFSLILKPDFPPDQASKITLVAALSVAQVLNNLYGIKVLIKWPNDIFINDKKMCGILTEMNAEIDQINFLVMGIGLNVNNSLPASLVKTSISLKHIIKKKVNRTNLLNSLLIQLEKNIGILEQNKFSVLLEEAKKLCLIFGKRIKVIVASKIFIGTCKDLDLNGNLILEEDNGNLMTIVSGDITFLRSVA